MEYIIASTGRCGSTAIARLIYEVVGKKGMPIATRYEDLDIDTGGVKKTHLHFKREPKCDYKALYVYGDIGDVIDSLYHNMEIGFIKFHLTNMEVNQKHLAFMLKILNLPIPRARRFLAFSYMVIGDKFRFKENIESWRKAKNVLFVKYEELCNDKRKVLKDISDYIGLEINSFEVKNRRASIKKLPFLLRFMIKHTYKEYC